MDVKKSHVLSSVKQYNVITDVEQSHEDSDVEESHVVSGVEESHEVSVSIPTLAVNKPYLEALSVSGMTPPGVTYQGSTGGVS